MTLAIAHGKRIALVLYQSCDGLVSRLLRDILNAPRVIFYLEMKRHIGVVMSRYLRRRESMKQNSVLEF